MKFVPELWVAPTCRKRRTKDGVQYRNIKYNKNTKTFVYEMKLSENEKWSGPFHGRTINSFLTLEDIEPNLWSVK